MSGIAITISLPESLLKDATALGVLLSAHIEKLIRRLCG
jgi:hypothetical protein